MAIEVKWTLQSIDDLVSIADFISKDSRYFAQIQTEKFFSRTEILEKHPESGRIVPELNDKNIRELIEGSYRIIYRILSKDRIDIVTVHHSSRLLKDFL